jgi:hypothetical protein
MNPQLSATHFMGIRNLPYGLGRRNKADPGTAGRTGKDRPLFARGSLNRRRFKSRTKVGREERGQWEHRDEPSRIVIRKHKWISMLMAVSRENDQ